MKHKEECFKSVCRVCHGGCSAFLFVEQGKVVRVKPDPDSPFSRGHMCSKGLATTQIMYSPSRLTTPLKRKGPRGSNQWEAVAWDVALDEIANKLDNIRKESGPEAVAIGQGTGRHHYMHVIRFANSFGTPNWFEPGLANCLLPRITVSQLTYGGFVAGDYYGDNVPKTILFWGHNPIVTSADGKLSPAVQKILRSGSFGIAVDPRRSETAKLCKMWLPIRPGTDAALALAMVNVIINEEIYDKEFAEKWTVGFDELKEHVSGYTPEWAEDITWIPAENIVSGARRYAIDKPSVLEWGVGIEQNPNSLQTVRALSLLRALTGNIDVPGGDLLGMRIVRPYPVLKNKLPADMITKRIGGEQFKLLGGFQSLLPSAHVPGVFAAMRTGNPYRIKALLVFGSNPLVTVPNPREVYQSLMMTDLLVVTDMFMTPTGALADYVLPAAFWPEVNQIMELPLVAENAVLAQQKVAQVGLCRQDEEIMIDLARRLNLPGSEESLESILDYRLEPLGLTFSEFKKRSIIFPSHQYRKFEKRGFLTPSRKVELFCRSLKKFGYDPLPGYKEPPESPIEQPALAAEFPYVLITGSRRPEFFHSEHRQIPALRQRRPDPTAEIHPVIADRHGILEGDWVYVSSPRGRIKMKAVVTEDIQRKVINIDHGWWFPEKQGPEFGMLESNANVLTSGGPPYDPAFGSYQLRGLLCNIEKIDDDESKQDLVGSDIE